MNRCMPQAILREERKKLQAAEVERSLAHGELARVTRDTRCKRRVGLNAESEQGRRTGLGRRHVSNYPDAMVSICSPLYCRTRPPALPFMYLPPTPSILEAGDTTHCVDSTKSHRRMSIGAHSDDVTAPVQPPV